jgi:MFS transporter, AAHS family, 3-hydroxyphenylpropionic acid transporter
MNTAHQLRGSSARGVLVLCAAAAFLEGFDTQSMGVAAPRLVPDFGLSTAQASVIFSAATLGLFFGAAAGGRIADRVGRKQTLTASMLLFGMCSLLTCVSVGARSLFLARLLTGIGLGGAMPNFIALASESTPPSRRLASVTVVMAGMPIGGAAAGLIALGDVFGWSWRSIFYVGGAAPIALSVLLWRFLPEPRKLPLALQPVARLESITGVLFGAGRALTTLELWAAYFFTQLVLLLMLNWLPSLILGLGYSHTQASEVSICFNLSGGLGAMFLGRLHAGANRRLWVIFTYAGIAAGLAFMPAVGKAFWLVALAGGLAGVFIIGAQLILFALAPLYYRWQIRGTGVGAAVAMGRLGSIVGPLFAGALLSGGGGSAAVLLGIVPFVALGGAAALALTRREQCAD